MKLKRLFFFVLLFCGSLSQLFPSENVRRHFYKEELDQLTVIQKKIDSNYAQAFTELKELIKTTYPSDKTYLAKQIGETENSVQACPSYLQKIWLSSAEVVTKEKTAQTAVRNIAKKFKKRLEKDTRNKEDRCLKHYPEGIKLVEEINNYISTIQKTNQEPYIKDIAEKINQLSKEKEAYDARLLRPLKEELDIIPKNLEKLFTTTKAEIEGIQKNIANQKDTISKIIANWSPEYQQWCKSHLRRTTQKSLDDLLEKISDYQRLVFAKTPITLQMWNQSCQTITDRDTQLKKVIASDDEQEEKIKNIEKTILQKINEFTNNFSTQKKVKVSLQKLKAIKKQVEDYNQEKINTINTQQVEKNLNKIIQNYNDLDCKQKKAAEFIDNINKYILGCTMKGFTLRTNAPNEFNELLKLQNNCREFISNKNDLTNFSEDEINKKIAAIADKIEKLKHENERISGIKEEVTKFQETIQEKLENFEENLSKNGNGKQIFQKLHEIKQRCQKYTNDSRDINSFNKEEIEKELDTLEEQYKDLQKKFNEAQDFAKQIETILSNRADFLIEADFLIKKEAPQRYEELKNLFSITQEFIQNENRIIDTFVLTRAKKRLNISTEILKNLKKIKTQFRDSTTKKIANTLNKHFHSEGLQQSAPKEYKKLLKFKEICKNIEKQQINLEEIFEGNTQKEIEKYIEQIITLMKKIEKNIPQIIKAKNNIIKLKRDNPNLPTKIQEQLQEAGKMCPDLTNSREEIRNFEQGLVAKKIKRVEEAIKTHKSKQNALVEAKNKVNEILQSISEQTAKNILDKTDKIKEVEKDSRKLLEHCKKFEENKDEVENFNPERMLKKIEKLNKALLDAVEERHTVEAKFAKFKEIKNPEMRAIFPMITAQLTTLRNFNKPSEKLLSEQIKDLSKALKEIETLLPESLEDEVILLEEDEEKQKKYLKKLHTYKNQLIFTLQELGKMILEQKETDLNNKFLPDKTENEDGSSYSEEELNRYLRLLKFKASYLLEKHVDKKEHPLYQLLQEELHTCVRYLTATKTYQLLPFIQGLFSNEVKQYNEIRDYHQKFFIAIETTRWLFETNATDRLPQNADFNKEEAIKDYLNCMCYAAATYDLLDQQKENGNELKKEEVKKLYKKLHHMNAFHGWLPQKLFKPSLNEDDMQKKSFLEKMPKHCTPYEDSKEFVEKGIYQIILQGIFNRNSKQQLSETKQKQVKDIIKKVSDHPEKMGYLTQAKTVCRKTPNIGNALYDNMNEAIKEAQCKINLPDQPKDQLLNDILTEQEAAEFIQHYLSKNNAHTAGFIILNYYEQCLETKSISLINEVEAILESVVERAYIFPKHEVFLKEFKALSQKARIATLTALHAAFDEKQKQKIIAYTGALLSGSQDQEEIYIQYLELFSDKPITKRPKTFFENIREKSKNIVSHLKPEFKNMIKPPALINPFNWFSRKSYMSWSLNIFLNVIVPHSNLLQPLVSGGVNLGSWCINNRLWLLQKANFSKDAKVTPPLKINLEEIARALLPSVATKGSEDIDKNVENTYAILRDLQEKILKAQAAPHAFIKWNNAKEALKKHGAIGSPAAELHYCLIKFENYLIEQKRLSALTLSPQSLEKLLTFSLEIALQLQPALEAEKNVSKEDHEAVEKLLAFADAAIEWEQTTKEKAVVAYGAFLQWCKENNYKPEITAIAHDDILPKLELHCRKNIEDENFVEIAKHCTTVKNLEDLHTILMQETSSLGDQTTLQTQTNNAYKELQTPWWQKHQTVLAIGGTTTVIACAAIAYKMGKTRARAAEQKQAELFTKLMQNYQAQGQAFTKNIQPTYAIIR